MPAYGALHPVKANGVLTAVVPPGVTVIEPMIPEVGVAPVQDGATPFRLNETVPAAGAEKVIDPLLSVPT